MSFKKLAKFTIILILTACSTIRVVPVEGDSFTKYVKHFELIYGKPITEVQISLGQITDLEGRIMQRVAAVCMMTKPRQIIINVLRWHEKPESLQEMLVFHELGHCVLNRAHTDLDEDYVGSEVLQRVDCPTSIMHSGTTYPIMTEWCYTTFREYYIMELFLEPRVREILFGSRR